MFVPNEIEEPSDETDHATALSLSLRGASPRTETSQIVVVRDDQPLGPSNAGWELTRNLLLSGNQAVEIISQSTSSFLSPCGSGTAWTSPVSRSLICIPLKSVYARYFPSGEIAPVFTRISEELVVSCRSLRSGRV